MAKRTRTNGPRLKSNKRKRPRHSPSAATVEVVRRLQLFADEYAPPWLAVVLKYAHVALSIIGFVTGRKSDANSRDGPEEGLQPYGCVTSFDIGVDELIAESPYVSGLPPEQVQSWGLTGVDYCMYSSARINWIELKLIPHARLADRGGTLIVAYQILSPSESEFDGTGTRHFGEKIDSFGVLASMPSAKTYVFDRPISHRIKGRGGWNAVGVPGNVIEGNKPPGKPCEFPWPLNRYASKESVCGGRPFCRIWIGYEDFAQLRDNHSDVLDLKNLSVDCQLKSSIDFAAPTGQPRIEKVDGVTVMNISTGNFVRRSPIIIEGGRRFEVTDRRQWIETKVKVVTTDNPVALENLKI